MAASPGAVRSYLARYFEEKAVCREKMAKQAGQRQRPWDVGKNDAYAKSLRRVAAHVAALPDDDLSLVALAECERLCDDYLGFQIPPANGPAIWADRGTLHCGQRGKGMSPGSRERMSWKPRLSNGTLSLAAALRHQHQRSGRAGGGRCRRGRTAAEFLHWFSPGKWPSFPAGHRHRQSTGGGIPSEWVRARAAPFLTVEMKP